MFRRTALAATAAVAAGLFLAPPASAEPGYNLDARLLANRTIFEDGDTWVAYTEEPFLFTVEVTNTGWQDDVDLSVFVSVPFEVTGFSGDRWNCADVEGGVQCSNPDRTVVGEAWPYLTINALPSQDLYRDSIDIYAESREGDAHTGVPFEVRTIG